MRELRGEAALDLGGGFELHDPDDPWAAGPSLDVAASPATIKWILESLPMKTIDLIRLHSQPPCAARAWLAAA